jgi:3-oxoacyl-[acyl-carrier-protein] synthase II
LGGLGFSHEQQVIYLEKGLMAINPYTASIAVPNSCTNYVSILLNARGPSQTFSSSCTAGADAIGYGYNVIRRGEADIMCVGGTDAPLFPGIFGAFCRLRILVTTTKGDTKVPRPFDLNRDGTVISEGAAILVLEELEHALKRGAHIYAEIVGYGSTCDAYHIVKPLPGGEQAARAIQIALEDANLGAEEVDYINAHGTATPKNDKVETKIIKDVFKQHAYELAVSATKSMVGHTQGACGAIEAICCALAVKHDILPPTINYETPDPECDLDYVPNKARKARVNIALSNSFGFGGKNSVLVIKKCGK